MADMLALLLLMVAIVAMLHFAAASVSWDLSARLPSMGIHVAILAVGASTLLLLLAH